MRVLLVDDEPLALDILERMLKEVNDIEIVGKYTDPRQVLENIARLEVDVLFLDMEMGGVRGLELAEEIMNQYSKIQIIFVTAHAQFALEAFGVNAIDYILKPIQKERLCQAIEKAKVRFVIEDERKQQAIEEEMMLFVYALGSFKLVDSKQELVQWRTRKVRELFIFLWHYRGKPIHKARLIEELWANMDIIKASQLLHTTVYQLRRTLKEKGLDKAIKLVNDHYVLTTPISSDVEELEQLVNSETVIEANIKRVLELYNGEYLEEEDYPWAIQPRQELRHKIVYCLDRFVSEKEGKQENPLLVQQCLEKMVELDEYNEGYIVRLIHFYGKTKNIQKLATFYETMKKTMKEELGIRISEKIMRTYENYIE